MSALIVSVPDIVHALAITVDIIDCVVHGIVEHCVDHSLVAEHVASIPIEDLSYHVATCLVIKLSPEILANVAFSVQTETIKPVCGLQPCRPVIKLIFDIIIALVEVGETSQPTLLNGVLVVPVDVALGVVMLCLVEGTELREVIRRAHVVRHDVHHYPNATRVSSRDKILQVLF